VQFVIELPPVRSDGVTTKQTVTREHSSTGKWFGAFSSLRLIGEERVHPPLRCPVHRQYWHRMQATQMPPADIFSRRCRAFRSMRWL